MCGFSFFPRARTLKQTAFIEALTKCQWRVRRVDVDMRLKLAKFTLAVGQWKAWFQSMNFNDNYDMGYQRISCHDLLCFCWFPILSSFLRNISLGKFSAWHLREWLSQLISLEHLYVVLWCGYLTLVDQVRLAPPCNQKNLAEFLFLTHWRTQLVHHCLPTQTEPSPIPLAAALVSQTLITILELLACQCV